MDIENVPFNKGFYSVDMTFYFLIRICAYLPNTSIPTIVHGLACFSKKVILFGSEGNVKTFSSTQPCQDLGDEYNGCSSNNVPEASVQVVEPIILGSRILENNCCCEENTVFNIPDCIASQFEGDFNIVNPGKSLLVTLGVFSIVSLKRDVQMMIPVYDFCLPDKECETTNDDPCDLFKRIKFPVDEFFPPRLSEIDDNNNDNCGI